MNMDRTNGIKLRSQFTIAIIGGGFTGVAVAAQVLRKSGGAVSVVLIEKGAQIGRGVAYGTQCEEHLLNVRAKNMSAFPDDPEHFLRWARSNYDPTVTPDDFLPRLVYGQYAGFVLRHEVHLHPGQFDRVEDEAVAIEQAGDTAEIHLRSGKRVSANKVVLALGNFPPGDPRFPGKTAQSQRYIANPYIANSSLANSYISNSEATSTPQSGTAEESVLLVGSGLTGVDVVIALRKQGFRGTIHISSRRGLLPHTHKVVSTWPPFWNKTSPRTARALMRLIRTQVEAAENLGSDWRAVIDSLRPFTQEIWRSLAQPEQRRFLRHLRPYWDVHRHRIAPEIGAMLAAELMSGHIQIHAGRITAYAEDHGGVDVTFGDRKTGKLVQLRVGRVVNCTGPEGDFRNVDNALLAYLLRRKMVRPDTLFLGLDVSPDGAVMDANGEASEFLFTVGPIRKGNLWESIAVPEIRVQAAEMATLLLASCAQEDSEVMEPELAVAGR